jgi:ectoine hydroxylase-related dioxygenase (phytanoyl-CoA dioxygenase family)
MAENLGDVSRPMTELFPQPQSPEEWRRYMLTEDQVRHFNEEGYLTGIRILNDEQVERLRSELHDIARREHPGNPFFYEFHSNESDNPETVLFHALGAWRVSPGFHDVLWAPAFRMAAYQLLGQNYRLFHDQLFRKPAKHGGVVSWHQDFSYWTWTAPMAHLTCWMALDNATAENGCMYYVPKSHDWGLLPKTGLAGDMDAVRQVLDDEQIAQFEKRVPIELAVGEATFHHPLLMHGSYENRSNRPRRATLINVLADGVISNRDPHGVNTPGAGNYPQVPKGAKMGGTYYPLLFDAEQELDGLKEDVVTVEDV